MGESTHFLWFRQSVRSGKVEAFDPGPLVVLKEDGIE
jgi:hypothetical protein